MLNRLKNEAVRRATAKPGSTNRERPSPIHLTLPFIDDDLCRRTEAIIKNSRLNFRVAWKGGPNLKKRLVRSAYLPPPCPGAGRHCNCCQAGLSGKCHLKNVIYRIDCSLCEKDQTFYVGETRRAVRLRYNEHLRDAKNNRPDTPFGSHQAQHPDTPLTSTNTSIQILHVCKDGPDRKILESMYIRDLKPTLNVQTSSWPLT